MSRASTPRARHQQVFAFLFCSLDGYHEGPGGELDWGTHDEEFFDWNLRQTREVGALLLGRRTYEHFADAWTSARAAEEMPEVTAFMNAVPKTVVTGSDRVTPWENTRVTDGGDLPAEVARLRAGTDGDVAVFGSSDLTVTLLEQGLVDGAAAPAASGAAGPWPEPVRRSQEPRRPDGRGGDRVPFGQRPPAVPAHRRPLTPVPGGRAQSRLTGSGSGPAGTGPRSPDAAAVPDGAAVMSESRS